MPATVTAYPCASIRDFPMGVLSPGPVYPKYRRAADSVMTSLRSPVNTLSALPSTNLKLKKRKKFESESSSLSSVNVLSSHLTGNVAQLAIRRVLSISGISFCSALATGVPVCADRNCLPSSFPLNPTRYVLPASG